MKKIITIVFCIVFASTASVAQKGAAASKADPSKGVRDAFDRLVEGIKQADAEKVMSSYEKSPNLLIFNNNGTATKGWDDVNTVTREVYAKLSNVTLDITGLNIQMLSKTSAFVTCKWVQTQENNGKLENAAGRMTLVYKLIGKDWKIVHRHTSPDKPDAARPVFPSARQP